MLCFAVRNIILASFLISKLQTYYVFLNEPVSRAKMSFPPHLEFWKETPLRVPLGARPHSAAGQRGCSDLSNASPSQASTQFLC